MRTGFLSSEDDTNAQDEAPTPVKARPSAGRSLLTAVEHDPRATAADVREEHDGVSLHSIDIWLPPYGGVLRLHALVSQLEKTVVSHVRKKSSL